MEGNFPCTGWSLQDVFSRQRAQEACLSPSSASCLSPLISHPSHRGLWSTHLELERHSNPKTPIRLHSYRQKCSPVMMTMFYAAQKSFDLSMVSPIPSSGFTGHLLGFISFVPLLRGGVLLAIMFYVFAPNDPPVMRL